VRTWRKTLRVLLSFRANKSWKKLAPRTQRSSRQLINAMSFRRHIQNPCSHFLPETSPLAPVDPSKLNRRWRYSAASPRRFYCRQSCSWSLLTFPSPPRAQFPGDPLCSARNLFALQATFPCETASATFGCKLETLLAPFGLARARLHPRSSPSWSDGCEKGETLRKQRGKSGKTGGVWQEHERSLRTIGRCQAPLRASPLVIEF
jgi:hypothetical protein